MPQAEKTPGPVGDDDLARLQFPHQGGPVQRAAATKGQQHEVARVMAAAHGDQLERVDHVGVGDADNAQRGLGDGEAEMRGNRLQGGLRALQTEADAPAKEIVGVDAPGGEVGVGERGFLPHALASRPGVCAGALRPHAQCACLVHVGDGTAARANFNDVDGRHQDGVAGAPPVMFDLVVAGDARRPIQHQRALGRRTAHVQRNDVRLADQYANSGGADDARHRPGFDQVDRQLPTGGKAGAAAVGLHHV